MIVFQAGPDSYEFWDGPQEPEPEATLPDIPWECHNTKPVDPEKAWAAVQAMCRG